MRGRFIAAVIAEEMRREPQNAFDSADRDLVVRGGLADARRENKAQSASARLLVRAHGINHAFLGDTRPGGKRAQLTHQRDNARNLVSSRHARLVSQQRRRHHPPSDRFAVLITAIMRDPLEGMRKGVSKIENFAQAGLALIA